MLSIRKATTGDCLLINHLATQVFPVTYRELLSAEQLEYMLNRMYSPESLRTQIAEQGHEYFIAYQDTAPCGYVSIEQQEEDVFHLQKIYVLPCFQGLGIGKFLFGHAVSYIKEIHPAPCLMELNVNRENKAVLFYEKLGMKKLRRGDFHIGNGYYMNDYIMGLYI